MYQNHEKSIQLEKELRSEIKSLHEKLQASLTQSTKKMNGLRIFIGQLIFLLDILLEGFLEEFLILLGLLRLNNFNT